MLKIGCHLSSAKGYMHMGNEITALGGNTFQFFTRNPRGGSAKPLDMEDIEKYNKFAEETGIDVILAHAPYTLNCASAEEKKREFAYEAFKEDIARLELVRGAMYNFHPGSHVGQGAERGTELIADILNRVIKPEQKTPVLLETMAGKGTEIGRNFQELRRIIDKVELSDKIGVCMDTCHVYDGEYDIVNDIDGVLEAFDSIIGIERLKAVHINDSKNHFGSHKDRHEKIGEGSIGIKAFERIINHRYLRELPFYLETPNDFQGYRREIEILKKLYK